MSDALDTPNAPAAAAALTTGAADPAPSAGAAPSGATDAPADRRSAAERAFDKADAARGAAGKGGEQPARQTTSTTTEQAPASSGASTPDAAGEPADQTAAQAAAGAPATPADSTAQAPQDWPEPQRAAFAALPPEGRALTLDFYKSMQAAFTQATTALSEQRRSHADLIATAERFAADPRAVLQQLGQQAGVEIFFTEAEARGEPPEFANPAEMAKWVAQQAEAKAEARYREQLAQAEQRAAADAARTALQRELADVAQAHPDFVQHRAAVLERLQRAPGLSVQEAYDLATVAGLRALAVAGRSAQTELAALKAKVENERKRSTEPVGAGAAATPKAPPQNLSPAERALARAEAKRAARQGARQ